MSSNPKLNGWLDSVINAVPAAIGVASQFVGGASPTGSAQPAKGLRAIREFVERVISGLNQILQAAPQIPKAEALQAANALIATLSDGTQVFQAKKGEDAKALNDGKRRAAELLTQIQAAYNVQAVIGSGVVATDAAATAAATGGAVTPAAGLTSGLSDTAKIGIGAGVAVVLLYILKK